MTTDEQRQDQARVVREMVAEIKRSVAALAAHASEATEAAEGLQRALVAVKRPARARRADVARGGGS
jgi:hypothetical protein